MSVKRICECIMRNEKSVMPVSSMMHGEYGIEGMCLSMPAVVGNEGVETHVTITMNAEETKKLQESAATLKEKTLSDYMAMSYRMEIIEDKDEGGFVVSYPDLPGCITCGETLESAVANAVDAKKAWLEAAIEESIENYEPGSLEDYSGQFKLRIPRSLHRSLVQHSRREGISMNQYCVYLLSKNDVMFSK